MASVTLLLTLISCSTQKNTGASRWWHSFNTRYNTYYNGAQAYIEGSLAKEQGNKDDFTEVLPLYTVENKASKELGKANFETAILKSKKAIKQHSIKKRPEWKNTRKKTERDIEWLNRKEYNPFMWKAWMLMGRSQFHKGAFDEAASTFSYMSRLYRTQPDIYAKSRAWLAKSYVQQGWLYDAEDVIRNMSRDSIDWRAQKEWNYTMADYYLHLHDYENAAVYLKRVITQEQRKMQRAREWYILGQIMSLQGRHDEAYNAFRHVIRQNPPYELEFNARIAMTENITPATAQGKSVSKTKLKTLKRMARSGKNADYLDQVYYAMGNILLADGDTANAVNAYEKGVKEAKRAGIEKGVLLLQLGNIYWETEKYSDARRCYGEAIGLLDKDRDGYEELDRRSAVLDELCPHTETIHLQDSLQQLSRMSETERNAAIDKIIDALKKKEKEEKLAELEKQAAANSRPGTGNATMKNGAVSRPGATASKQNSVWYFYNPTAVKQGMQAFRRQWGERENTDDWQRINKTVVATENNADMAETDSTQQDMMPSEEKATPDSAVNDPHRREYYLAQIPFTEEQLAESNSLIADALFGSAIIFKDKLDNLALSEKAFMRLVSLQPDYALMDEVYYHLFLLYSRKGERRKAETYKTRLVEAYPQSQLGQIISDPNYEYNARYGTHLEDSLYAETYNAFRNNDFDTVLKNGRQSERLYPLGVHRDRFLFVNGMTQLETGRPDSCINAMRRIVEDYPQSPVAKLAGMILNGVKDGRKLHKNSFVNGNIWDMRLQETDEAADTVTWQFSDEPSDDYIYLMAYIPDSLAADGVDATTAENRLLFELARYNFTSFLVRNFEIATSDEYLNMHSISVSGFHTIEEAMVYARRIASEKSIQRRMKGVRTIIISRQNLALLGTRLSYNDYEEFFSTHYAPMELPSAPILNEQIVSPEDYDPERHPSAGGNNSGAETDNEQTGNNSNTTLPESQGITISDDIPLQPVQGITVSDDIPLQPAQGITVSDDIPLQQSQGITVSDDTPLPQSQGITVSDDTPVSNDTSSPIKAGSNATGAGSSASTKAGSNITGTGSSASTKAGSNVTGAGGPAADSTKASSATPRQNAVKSKNKTERQVINSDILEIIDDAPDTKRQTTTKQKQKKQQKRDDEYFEFDGF